MRKKTNTEYPSLKYTRRKYFNSKSIGKTIAADSYPITIDAYWFVVMPGTILSTFDSVTVNNFKSKTIGLVHDIRALPHVVLHDRPVYDELSDYAQENKSLEQLLTSIPSPKDGVKSGMS